MRNPSLVWVLDFGNGKRTWSLEIGQQDWQIIYEPETQPRNSLEMNFEWGTKKGFKGRIEEENISRGRNFIEGIFCFCFVGVELLVYGAWEEFGIDDEETSVMEVYRSRGWMLGKLSRWHLMVDRWKDMAFLRAFGLG